MNSANQNSISHSSINENKRQDLQRQDILFTLPAELISEIFSFLNPKDLLNLSETSKQAKLFLSPNSPTGSRTWSSLRKKLKLPSPAMINKTDYEFFKIQYSTGCDYCSSRPQTRKVFWEFGGKRICSDCQRIQFLKGYRTKYPYLLSTFVSWRHVYYLKSDIPTRDLSQEEMDEISKNTMQTFKFMEELQKVETDRLAERKRVDNEKKRIRVEEITEFLRLNIPDLNISQVEACKVFRNSVNKTSSFASQSSSGKTRFLNKIKTELAEMKALEIKRIFLERIDNAKPYGISVEEICKTEAYERIKGRDLSLIDFSRFMETAVDQVYSKMHERFNIYNGLGHSLGHVGLSHSLDHGLGHSDSHNHSHNLNPGSYGPSHHW